MMYLPLKLEHAIREVAAQYHRRQRLRGRLVFGAALLGLLAGLGIAVALLEETRAPMAVPFGVFAALVGLAAWQWLYRPLKRKADRREIARFLDAHHPELEDLVLSSVSFSESVRPEASAWMVEKVFENAREPGMRIRLPALAEASTVRRMRRFAAGVWAAGAVVLAVLLLSWDLGGIGARFFRMPAEAAPAIEVAPGNARVRRGADQTVWVTTDQGQVSKAIRWRQGNGAWQTGVLEPGEAKGGYAFRLKDLQADTEYQVLVGRYRSPVYRFSVWTPPGAVSIGLTYRYPEYLEMPDREVPYGGDISAPEGTEVRLDVAVNKALERAEVALESGERVALEQVGERIWRGYLQVAADDAYRVALRDVEGEENPDPQTYRIAADRDGAAEVRIRFPRGDDEVTPLEEVRLGFLARDDYGLTDYGVQYEVAGREPVRVSLKQGRGRVAKAEVEYLLAMEELNVSPGDLITWTAWAEDGKPGRTEMEGLGDPYFLTVRPFARFFRPAVSNAGAQQMSQGSGENPVERQKQVMIATWNLRKAAKQLEPGEFVRQLQAILEAEEGVQVQVEMNAIGHGAGAGPLEELKKELSRALDALAEAFSPPSDGALSRAMGHEQRAYRYMAQMEPDEVQVGQGRGGGGGARQRELDGLELARRRDFREEASTLQEQLAAAEKAGDRIDDLARRQAAVNEDIARLISEMEGMDEAEREEARRRLEQLREAQRRTMAALDEARGEIASGNMDAEQARQAREQLDAARGQMDRSARNMEGESLQQARAAGNRALDALREVQDQLSRLSRGAAAERMEGLQAAMDSLRARQRRIAEGARSPERKEGARELGEPERDGLDEEQEAQAEAFRRFMDDAGELAERAAEHQGLMARKLGDWLRETSREGIYEAMQEGRRLSREGDPARAVRRQEEVGAKLDLAAARLDSVAQFLVRDDLDAMEKALERLQTVLPESGGAWGAEEMRQFMEEGYGRWMEAVREAEALAPEGEAAGGHLADAREGLWGIGQRYRREAAPPQYDLMFDEAIKPLQLAAEDLREAIRARRKEYGFAVGDADAVPESYRPHVAEYFKTLSGLEE